MKQKAGHVEFGVEVGLQEDFDNPRTDAQPNGVVLKIVGPFWLWVIYIYMFTPPPP